MRKNQRAYPNKAATKAPTANNNAFDPNNYMLKLPKNKKVKLTNGQIKWEKVETDYLPVAPRIV